MSPSGTESEKWSFSGHAISTSDCFFINQQAPLLTYTATRAPVSPLHSFHTLLGKGTWISAQPECWQMGFQYLPPQHFWKHSMDLKRAGGICLTNQVLTIQPSKHFPGSKVHSLGHKVSYPPLIYMGLLIASEPRIFLPPFQIGQEKKSSPTLPISHCYNQMW